MMQAVDRSTLMQLRGQTAKGYAFDKRYGPEHTSDNIYDDCVSQLVENLFKVCATAWATRLIAAKLRQLSHLPLLYPGLHYSSAQKGLRSLQL